MSRNLNDDVDEEGELPWTEQQWEEFMKRSDLRAARFGELLETMRDDPDRDVKLAREMGWDDLAEALEAADSTLPPDAPALETPAEPPASSKPVRRPRPPAGSSANPFRSRAVSKRIPELKPLSKITLRVDQLLRDIVHAVPESDDDPRWSEAFSGPMTAEAKLVGGDGMGYTDDAICGNIVKVRHGLASLETGLAAVRELSDEGKLDSAVANEVIAEYTTAIELVRDRIARLRERVWWQ